MAINIFLLGLTKNTLILTAIFYSLVLNSGAVLADLSVIPLWNVSLNKTDQGVCHLDIDTDRQDVIEFTGSPSQTCGIQLETFNGTAALIHIHKNVSVYAERKAEIPECHKRYVSFQSNEPCIAVFQHPQVQLFMEATGRYDDSIAINSSPVNDSSSICPKYTSDEEQHESKVSQIIHCHFEDSDELFSCQLSPDYTCSVKFPANCNVVLGTRLAQFYCSGDDLLFADRDALIVYPPGSITLDLSKQRITEIKGSSFAKLKSLKKLYLERNKLTTLHSDLFKGLKRLRELNMQKNLLKNLPRNIFSELGHLNKLDLGKNNLSSLDKTVFTELRNLTHLYLISNRLTFNSVLNTFKLY